MSRPDLINGLFEISGSIAIWANVLKLWKDKKVQGTHWQMMIFFSSWALWNLYFYPHLDQWLSFAGGCSMAVSEVIWTVLAACYMTRSKS